MYRQYIDGPNGQVHFVESGAGEAVLLFHQTASSSVMWNRVMPLIAEKYRVIAIDTPGFGLSDPPESPACMQDYTGAALAVLNATGIEKAHAVGFHTGASIALDLAARYPDRAVSAVLAGILAIETDEEMDRWRREIIKPWEPDGQGKFAEDQADFLKSFLPEDDGELLLGELLARLQAGPNYWWAYQALIEHRPYELISQLTNPVLVLNPVEDMLVRETKRFYSLLKNAKYVEIPGGVVAASDHPNEFAFAVTDFLDGLVR